MFTRAISITYMALIAGSLAVLFPGSPVAGQATFFILFANRNDRTAAGIGVDNTIYLPVGSVLDSSSGGEILQSGVHALTPEGTTKWIYKSSLSFYDPVIGPEGTVYLATRGERKQIIALDSDGREKWLYSIDSPQAEIQSALTVGPDGTIYCAAESLYALTPGGELKWSLGWSGADFPYSFRTKPAVSRTGTIYLANKYFMALDPGGKMLWAYEPPLYLTPSYPAIGPDGIVYFLHLHGDLYAMSPDGRLKWTFQREQGHDMVADISAPVVAGDGTVYVGSTDYKFYAINPDGSLKWEYRTPLGVVSAPAVGADGTVYFGLAAHKGCDEGPCPPFSEEYESFVFALTPEGNLKWRYPLNYGVISPLKISKDGILYFLTDGGMFFAIDTGTGSGLDLEGWPTVGFNAANSGTQFDLYLDNFTGKDFNRDGRENIVDVISFLLLGNKYPDHPLFDRDGNGFYNVIDVVSFCLELMK